MTSIANVNSITINNSSGSGYGPFYGKSTITSVDLGNAPWTNNSMEDAFHACSNLTTVTNINQNITTLYDTFWRCIRLVNAPVIPNSVTNMAKTFSECANLQNPPAIPISVVNMRRTFEYCNLISAPTIPNSVDTMNETFLYCQYLAGDVFIESNQIINATDCFARTSITKNVYIPFTYSNGVNTQTYNSFISAGYTTDGSLHGVYLKDIGTH